MTIKDNSGVEIPITAIRSGCLRATGTFDDYGIKYGHEYTVHYADDTGAYIFGDGTIRLWNGELRQDVADKLIWIE